MQEFLSQLCPIARRYLGKTLLFDRNKNGEIPIANRNFLLWDGRGPVDLSHNAKIAQKLSGIC